jgi:hypothetical protein
MRGVIALRERVRFKPVKVALYEIARVIGGGSRNPAVDIGILGELSPEELSHKAVHRSVGAALAQLARLNPAVANWDAYESLTALVRNHPLDSPVRILLAYIGATRGIGRIIAERRLETAAVVAFSAHAVEMQNALNAAEASFPASFSYTFHRACLASLSDRAEASRLYAQATAEAPLAAEEMPFQVGMHTYFSDADIPNSDSPRGD